LVVCEGREVFVCWVVKNIADTAVVIRMIFIGNLSLS
jgi:hypothetical protein